MYVISVKLSKKRILSVVAALCVAVAIIFVALPVESDDVLANDVDVTAKTVDDHIAFLNNYGYNVSETPVQIQEIIIPAEFSEEYNKYNELQKLSGFDLSAFKSKRVKQYTYKILNYTASDEEVVANLLIHNSKIIGGDISSTKLGGFVHGFVKE